MTAVLTIPFYWADANERGEVTRKVFRHYRSVADEVGLEIVGVGSEGSVSERVFHDAIPDGHYIEWPQDWTATPRSGGSPGLRAKFDAAIQATRQFDPDHVFICGSDDVVTAEFFRLAIKSEADLVGVGGGAEGGTRVVQLATGRVFEWRGGYGHAPEVRFCGGILRLNRRLLDAWDWSPFAWEGDEVGIELRARADRYLLEELLADRDGFVCWNVKTHVVINQWSNILKHHATAAPDHIAGEFAEWWASL